MRRSLLVLVTVLLVAVAAVKSRAQLSQVWVSDLGNGSYKNPVLHADYSDPDVVRVGSDYYMTSSSFNAVPGLPILHSKDLVNWNLVGHALKRQIPIGHFSTPQHGNGVWAPVIRHHNGEFYLYYPDPDFGIYLTKAEQVEGPWSEPVLVESGKGLIDPCPLWDDDGNNYLVHAFAGSRAGIKSVLVVKRLNATGDQTLDEGRIVYDGHELDPTVEGPKFYKRNGYYYIFAPAGGVATGWQVVLRSKHIYGPYERRVVMDQGRTTVNGPHQGAWVDTSSGENWFIHFQDKGPYGRVVHLQPLRWINDWPVIGIDKDGDGLGEPVATYKKPDVGKTYPATTPGETDEFNATSPGLQWQWQANPRASWLFMNAGQGSLRLYSQLFPENARNLWSIPNLFMQKFPAEEFTVTARVSFKPNGKIEGEKAGLVVMGLDYASIAVKSTKDGSALVYSMCKSAPDNLPESETIAGVLKDSIIYFRVNVRKGGLCNFSYSVDGKEFAGVGESFSAKPGKWVGAKVGLFCTRPIQTNDSGYADFDWFRIEKLQTDLNTKIK
jgi:beta-xylosidase